MNMTDPQTDHRVPIGPYDQLVVTHPALEHDSTAETRYSLITLTPQLGPSSVLLLQLLNAGRVDRQEHTTIFDAGDLARMLGLNATRFDHTIGRLARFAFLNIGRTEIRNGQQFIEITLDAIGAR